MNINILAIFFRVDTDWINIEWVMDVSLIVKVR